MLASTITAHYSRPAMLRSKTEQLRAAWNAGDRIAALRIASRFHDRSADTRLFKRGWDAHTNPGFYRQIGRDPARLTAEAIEAMARKFGLDMRFKAKPATRETIAGLRSRPV